MLLAVDYASLATASGTLALAVAAVGTAWWAHHNELGRDRLRAWAAERDRTIADLDETRRLLVIVIHRPDALASADLYGSLVHALGWHSWFMSPDRAAQMLDRWGSDGSSRDELDTLIEIIVGRLDRLRALQPLAPLPPLDSI